MKARDIYGFLIILMLLLSGCGENTTIVNVERTETTIASETKLVELDVVLDDVTKAYQCETEQGDADVMQSVTNTGPAVATITDIAAYGYYVFPYSSERAIQEDDIDGMTAKFLRIGRNEIYARHGRRFDSEDLQHYFDLQSWYQGSISPCDFDERCLSEIEKNNVRFLQELENRWNDEEEMVTAQSCKFMKIPTDGSENESGVKVSYWFTDDSWSDIAIGVTIMGKTTCYKFAWGNSVESAYLLDCGSRTQFLYIEPSYSGDACCVDVFKIQNGIPVFVGETKDAFYGEIPVNADNFRLSTQLDTVSSYFAYRNYHIGPNGIPESDDSTYTGGITLITKREISAFIGEELNEPSRIPAGISVTVIRTDAQCKYVELQDNTGKIYRIVLEPNKFGYIDGVHIYECFDGAIIAN